MSVVINKLQRMLTQAQMFADDAPLEAVARVELALREANAALAETQGEEREQVLALRAMAAARVENYGARLSGWSAGVRERADLFESHEQQALEQPIAPKV